MINTKHVQGRRTLSFHTMDDILADVESLRAAGEVTSKGNWTPGQIVDHVRRFISGSMDGFNTTAPLLMRILGSLLRKKALRDPIKPGFTVPKSLNAFRPADGISWDDATDDLRKEILRIRAGKLMDHPSPMFGNLSHEEWTQLHCRHAELHFSFLSAS